MGLIRRYKSEIHGNYKRAWLQYGIITSIAMVLSVLIRYALTYPIESSFSWTDDVIILICLVGFTITYRSTLPEKLITFKEIYVLNLGIGFISAIIFGFFIWYYASRVDISFPDRYYASMMAQSETSELSPDVYETQTKAMSTPGNLALQGGVLTFVNVLVLGFFVAIFLKTEKQNLYKKQ